MNEELRRTAIHEAGHFVARYRFGCHLYSVSAEPDHELRWLGYCDSEDTSHWSTSVGQENVLSLCAGYAAVVASGVDPEIAALGCGSDFERAENIISLWGLPSLEEQKKTAIAMMLEPKNRKAVDVVADELIAHGTVGWEWLEVIVDHADGVCTDEDLAMILRSWKVLGIERYRPGRPVGVP